MVVHPPLSQAVGYVVVVVIGLVIAFGNEDNYSILKSLIFAGMVFVTKLLKRTVGEDNKKTEMYVSRTCYSITFCLTTPLDRFMTANRSVNTGLTTSAVVSVCHLSYWVRPFLNLSVMAMEHRNARLIPCWLC